MFTRSALTLLVTLPLFAAASFDPPDLTDPEVAHVAVTAGNIDVELGRLALDKASDEDVRGFAQAMVSSHSSLNETAAELAGKLGVTPQENAVSRSLLEDAARSRSKLEGLKGEEFDRAYIEREVAYHRAVIDAVRSVLIPTTENEDLRALLEQAVPIFETHLERAEAIKAAL